MVFAKNVQSANFAAATTHDTANCVRMTLSKTLSRSLHVSNVLNTLARFFILAGNQYQSVCAVLGSNLCHKQDCVRLAQQAPFALPVSQTSQTQSVYNVLHTTTVLQVPYTLCLVH